MGLKGRKKTQGAARVPDGASRRLISSLKGPENCEGQVQLQGNMMSFALLHARYATATLTTFRCL